MKLALLLSYKYTCMIIIIMGISFIFLMFPFEVKTEDISHSPFKIYDEIEISSKEMNCDYSLEDYRRLVFNFEYPKIIIMNDNTPIVVFIDENSKKLIFVNISKHSFKIMNSIPSFEGNVFEKWPSIFLKDDKINLVVMKKISLKEKSQYRIQLLSLEKESIKLNLEKEIIVPNEEILKNSFLSGMYSFNEDKNEFIVIGGFNESHFHPLALFSGDFPTFIKHFSFIWNGNQISKYQQVEKKGWFSANRRVYAISDMGVVNCAWVRDTSHVGFSTKHNESVLYSHSKIEDGWIEPFELYSVRETDIVNQIGDISITSNKNTAYLLWIDRKKGVYFGEATDTKTKDIMQIGDVINISKDLKYIEPLYLASTTSIAVDKYDNAYALWVQNEGSQYKIFLRARINGKWIEVIVVNSGSGTVKLPDMKVDKNGVIHITYIKKKAEEKYYCYYQKVERRGQTEFR